MLRRRAKPVVQNPDHSYRSAISGSTRVATVLEDNLPLPQPQNETLIFRPRSADHGQRACTGFASHPGLRIKFVNSFLIKKGIERQLRIRQVASPAMGMHTRWFSLVATTGDVVEIATSVPAAQSFGHGGNFIFPSNVRVGSLKAHPCGGSQSGRVKTDTRAAKDGAPSRISTFNPQ